MHLKTTKKNKNNAVSVVVADGSAATATPGHSTELLHAQHQQQQQHNNSKISHLATIRGHQSHRTCPAHAFTHTKEPLTDAAMLSGCSDASTNSSAELLDVDDDKIAPIFEEDIDEVVDEEEEEEDEDNCDEEDEEECEDIDEEEEAEDEDEGEEDDDEDVECVEIDVERDDMEFCGTSRKSTYSVKSSVSRYDKLLTLAAPKQPAVMPTSQSFNDNSNATNTKLQQLKHKKQLKDEHKVQRWRGKFKVDKVKNYSTEQQQQHADKKSSTIAGGSQKNIVKRALLSLASGSSSSARPKSTSSLKFGHNKLHFLAVGHKSNKTKHKQEQLASLNNELTIITTDAEGTNMEAAAAPTTTTITEGTTTTATTTTTTTTKSNLGNIITSLLRTTTL